MTLRTSMAKNLTLPRFLEIRRQNKSFYENRLLCCTRFSAKTFLFGDDLSSAAQTFKRFVTGVHTSLSYSSSSWCIARFPIRLLAACLLSFSVSVLRASVFETCMPAYLSLGMPSWYMHFAICLCLALLSAFLSFCLSICMSECV